MVTGCYRNYSYSASTFTSANIYRSISAINCIFSPSRLVCLILSEFSSVKSYIRFPQWHTILNFSEQHFPHCMLVMPSLHPGLRNQHVFKSNPSSNFYLFSEMLTVSFSSVAVFNRLAPWIQNLCSASNMNRTFWFLCFSYSILIIRTWDFILSTLSSN